MNTTRRKFIISSAMAGFGLGNRRLGAMFASPRLSEVKHIVIVMQENRSVDHYLGDLSLPKFYGSEFDGSDHTEVIHTGRRSIPWLTPYHMTQNDNYDPPHSWRSMWSYYNGGKMDGWTPRSMGYYTSEDLPFYHSLASSYATSDRYFCGCLGPTHPNRSLLLAGTTFGFVSNFTYNSIRRRGIVPRLLMDDMREAGYTSEYYTDGKAFCYKMFGYPWKRLSAFQNALDTGTLPNLVFLDAVLGKTDEHPTGNPEAGEDWVKARLVSLMNSSAWDSTVVFFSYDENGGFYDHVPPPETVQPDEWEPLGSSTYATKGMTFKRLGFRVPFMVVSNFAKRHYVSHQVASPASIRRFIQLRFGLRGNLRDESSYDLMDMFDFV